MSSRKEIFHETGPKYLTAIDWKNTDHKRSVVASLVQGVYSLERDRQRENPCGDREDNAKSWWTFFNFHLDKPLIDHDGCIFGAIYKYNGKYELADSDIPKYVIAFRGTLLTLETAVEDISSDFKCFLNKLEKSSHFKLALNYVESFVEAVEANGARNVWLAGHSLGSAMALLLGKKMILKREWFPEAYLFNPPFPSFPIELLEDEKVKKEIRWVHSMLKASLIFFAKASSNTRMEDHLALLSPWTPHMFVNPADICCAAYIAYFKRKDGAGQNMKLAENYSLRTLFNHVACQNDLEDTMHLLPSAILIVNESHPNKKAANNSSISDFLKAHTLSQWWRPDARCQSTVYQ